MSHACTGEHIVDARFNLARPYPEMLILDVGGTFNRRQHLLRIPLSSHAGYPLFQSADAGHHLAALCLEEDVGHFD